MASLNPASTSLVLVCIPACTKSGLSAAALQYDLSPDALTIFVFQPDCGLRDPACRQSIYGFFDPGHPVLRHAFEHAMSLWPGTDFCPLLEVDTLPGALSRASINTPFSFDGTNDAAAAGKAVAKLLTAHELAVSWVNYARVRGQQSTHKLPDCSILELLSKPGTEIVDVCKDAVARAAIAGPYRCAVCVMYADRSWS